MKFSPIVLSATILLGGCNSQTLTRSRAADIIKTGMKFPQPITDTFTVGLGAVPQTSLDAALNSPQLGKYIRALLDHGLVTMEWRGTKTQYSVIGGNQEVGVIWTDITPKGQQYLVGPYAISKTSTQSQRVTLRMCERQFDEVTGISAITQGIMQVNYTWKIAGETPFQKIAEESLGNGKGVCASPGFNDAAARLKLYDDGWRFESMVLLH
jgi:hypothetical protein